MNRKHSQTRLTGEADMPRKTFGEMILQFPALELLVWALGISGVAGVLGTTWSESPDWWTRNFTYCGFASFIISLFIDNVPTMKRWKMTLLISVMGIGSLAIFFGVRGDGPVIGLVIFWIAGVALLLSAILRSVRGGLATMITYRHGHGSQVPDQQE